LKTTTDLRRFFSTVMGAADATGSAAFLHFLQTFEPDFDGRTTVSVVSTELRDVCCDFFFWLQLGQTKTFFWLLTTSSPAAGSPSLR
jgi:hypothetical protein